MSRIEGAVAMRNQFQLELAGFERRGAKLVAHSRHRRPRALAQFVFQIAEILELAGPPHRQIDPFIFAVTDAGYEKILTPALRVIEQPHHSLRSEPIGNASVGGRFGKNVFVHYQEF
jgi:hypothetical protein